MARTQGGGDPCRRTHWHLSKHLRATPAIAVREVVGDGKGGEQLSLMVEVLIAPSQERVSPANRTVHANTLVFLDDPVALRAKWGESCDGLLVSCAPPTTPCAVQFYRTRTRSTHHSPRPVGGGIDGPRPRGR